METEIRGPNTLDRVLAWTTFVVMVLATGMVFLYAPVEQVMRYLQKIFYFHVATAWVAFFAFFIVFIASIAYLKTRNRKWDIIGVVSAEIGITFTVIVLLTGPIWGKAWWKTWWTWDPRLTTTLILLFIYLAYLLIRSSAGEDEKKARFGAIFGIIGFIDVPIVFMSVRWWRTIHPVVVDAQGMNMTPEMLQTLLVSVAAFTLLYFYLLRKGIFIERVREEVNDLKQALRENY